MRLEGKVALVTGSGRGIGKAIALRFAREGADVVVCYGHKSEEAEATREEVVALGRRAHVVKAALGPAEVSLRMIEDGVQGLGRLDLLVNNAGAETKADFLAVTEKDYDAVLDVNLKATFFASQAFAKHVIERKAEGVILNVSSVHEEIPFPGYAAYCASKGGMRMLTRDLAVELGPKGIRVNGIAPGATETEINKDMLADPKKRAALLAQIPLRRLGKPEDVAGLAAFLASDDAAYMTGSTTFVDGGLTWFYEE